MGKLAVQLENTILLTAARLEAGGKYERPSRCNRLSLAPTANRCRSGNNLIVLAIEFRIAVQLPYSRKKKNPRPPFFFFRPFFGGPRKKKKVPEKASQDI